MSPNNPLPSEYSQALASDYQALRKQSLQQINDLENRDYLRFQLGQLYVDCRRHFITRKILAQLHRLLQQRNFDEQRQALFSGGIVNTTEQRAALHWALRWPEAELTGQLHQRAASEIATVLEKMQSITHQLQSRQWLGVSGQPIRDVVHIGIGGSYLGPKLVHAALVDFWQPTIRVHFVCELDSHAIEGVLSNLDPQTTLFITVSKSFRTQETLQNTITAKQWLQQGLPGSADLSRQFIAVTSDKQRAVDFGIACDLILPMWDTIGGRYSIWSAVGLPVMLATSVTTFQELLLGAYTMDRHFQTAPLMENLPVMLALLGIGYINFLACQTHAVLPYNHTLRDLPAFLQQLEMESNGKSVNLDGEGIDYATAPVVWGQTGIHGQHAYYQMLHQGSLMVPMDFIYANDSNFSRLDHRSKLIANFLAHSSVFSSGKSLDEVKQQAAQASNATALDEPNQLAFHQVLRGSRPTTMMLLNELSAGALGQLLALYEHKVFVQSVIWRINAFDQWGVEEGKHLATLWQDVFNSSVDSDSVTYDLLDHLKKLAR